MRVNQGVPCFRGLCGQCLFSAAQGKVERDLEYVKDGHQRNKVDLFLQEKAGNGQRVRYLCTRLIAKIGKAAVKPRGWPQDHTR